MAEKNLGSVSIGLEITSPNIDIVDKTRDYEKVLVGKKASDAHLITSRIDCMMSCAHTITSLQAAESALGVKVSRQTNTLRELMLLVEIIKSHAEYLYKKIIPRMLGASDYFEFAKNFKKDWQRYLTISSKAEEFLRIIGGRYPHPVTTVVGGFLKVPDDEERATMIELLKGMGSEIEKTAEFLSKNMNNTLDASPVLVSLWELDKIPLLSGKVSVNGGQKEASRYYKKHNSLSMVGPIARVSNNPKLLCRTAEKIVEKTGLKFPLKNPFANILCMGIEMINFGETGMEILQNTHFEEQKPVKFRLKKAHGYSAVESAKGLIFCSYSIDGKGKIKRVRIVSNIEQNTASLQKAVKSMPMDHDTKTRREILDEIEFLVDAYYL